ncbi:DUF3857 domain-containing protein [Dysgonomonas massiliensis]|uniref:DUF3857 domain-containing protein n=1 Tax=Dysgonomonas massiliensis TaxID=2040292 RepID=UPI000C77678D|nr:DUF3857 domain-containing protein [Dysgonomonas massiliensis]
MYKILLGLIVSTISIILPSYGQDYTVNTIPDSLKKNANAVIRDLNQTYIQTDANNGIYTVNKVVTILNRKGDDYAHFVISTDKFSELTKFSGILRDASGKIIKKIKKGDLLYSSLEFNSFTTGSYKISYECQSPSYPFTIEYDYELKSKNGILYYPYFIPIIGTNIATENISFTLEAPQSIKVRHHSNCDYKINHNTSNNKDIYTIQESNISAIEGEIWQPKYTELYPIITFAPSSFCYDSYCGNMDSWNNYGKWVNQLLQNRDILPADLIDKLQTMTSSAQTEREKIKIVYEYLQQNTRYISVQLGIGGLQPETATNVAKNKMGDCKGLSFLMKAMLKVINIESNYCEIYSGKGRKYLDANFPSMTQTNHAILLVPLDNDSIWLECTNSTIPFGFIHSNIVDHDVIAITNDGGKLCHIPAYNNKDYTTETVMTINLDETGAASGYIELKSTMDVAMYVSDLKKQDRETQIKYLMSEVKMPKVKFGNIDIAYSPSEKPIATVSSKFEASNIANKTGSRLFLRSYPLSKGNFRRFGSAKRIHDIEIPQQYIQSDIIKYVLPEGYSAESLPTDISIENEFGKFTRKLSVENNIVTSKVTIDIKSGKYDKSSYEDLKSFFGKIDSALATRLVFKKD